ncbi:ShlB/FhaC/HecB family hemolysin secretion/activation protein [Acidocella facilis]|uniref:ShlB/FhaC/HecB family hemolysin secretion/activation protein n=1 Tax=Acidocella facilis TaxID=525 RepID=UPI001F46CCA1|nr:ShlB/FhaC/HecB family hemolysin secretion/activation protein [Acidocella facilis]
MRRATFKAGRIARAAMSGAGLVMVAGHCALAQTASVPSLATSPLPHIMPQTPTTLGKGLPDFSKTGTEGPLPAVSIQVHSASIVGATAFPAAKLNGMIAGLAGQSVPLTKLEAARLALVRLYRSHGYILSTVTLDVSATGDVRFVVTEGYVTNVKLSKDIGPAGTMVLGFLNHLTQERPLREAALERWLLLAQQVPGVSVHAVLQADQGNPGALTLVAEVSKQTFSGLVTADNRGFDETGPAEGLLVADINSLTAHGDQTEISYFHTSGNTDNFGQISESFFIGTSGLQLKLYGGAGRAHPSGVLRSAGYQSQVEVFGGQLSYPVLLRRNQALTARVRLDAAQSRIMFAGSGASGANSADSLRVARLGGQYAWQDLWLGNSRNALNVLEVQYSQGLPLLGSSADGRTAPPGGRAQAKFDFWKFNGSISRVQTLFSPWPAADVALRTEVGGQYSTAILPSAEEFYLGGTRFTRGYYSGEVVGDKAAYATAELQLNTGTDFTLFKHDFELGAQFYGFYDWGETWANLPTDLNHRIASVGGGVRLGLTRNLELDGEVTHRLVTQLVPGSTHVAPLSETIIYWGVTARF